MPLSSPSTSSKQTLFSPPWCRTNLSESVSIPALFTELPAPYEFKHSAYPLPQWRRSVLTPSVYSILLALGRTALNGCGLVIWGLICKANANYLKLGLRGIEHSLKIAFVLFENHSLAWQDCYHQSGKRIGELDPFVHCRKSIPFFWVTGSYGKRQWRQVTGQSQLRTGLRGEGLGQKAGCPGGDCGQ